MADGPSSRVVESAIDGRIEPVIPGLVLDELEDVLVRKLRMDATTAAAARTRFEALAAEVPTAPESAPPVTGDADDDRILAAAVVARVDVLVTGDRKHLLPLATYQGIGLVTPQALLAELSSGRISPA